MASCPKCPTKVLSPTLLAAGLSAKGCRSCHGVLLDLLSYRAWSDLSGIDTVDSNDKGSEVEVDDTRQAIVCPNCGALMTKYKISSEIDNKLDYCANCDEAWLDGSEWAQLADMGLRMNLGTIFTEPWQRRVRTDSAESNQEALRQEKYGEDYEKIIQFRDWLSAHPHREAILAILAHRDH